MKQASKRKRIGHIRAKGAEGEDALAGLFRHALKSALITVCIGAALSVIASLICYFSEDPVVLITPLSYTASALTAISGGVIAVRIHKRAALLSGLLTGSILTLLMMLASLFLSPLASGYSTGIAAALHAAYLALCVLGAFLGQKKPSRRRRKR